MSKRVWFACLALLSMSAQASPIVFFDAHFDVVAVALTSGAPGFDSQSSPPGATPVFASAASFGTTDIATAGAVAGPGVLTASADVSGAGGITDAVGSAHFLGSFLSTGPVNLNIDFTSLSSASGSGNADTSLFVAVTSGGMTLFQGFIDGSRQFTFDLTAGTTSLLELMLSSEASTGFPAQGVGNASSFGFVGFAGNSTPRSVPNPATWLLLALGAAALVGVRWNTNHRSSSVT